MTMLQLYTFHLYCSAAQGVCLGQSMWMEHEARKKVKSPLKYEKTDHPQVTNMKILASAMINFDPKLRPHVEAVLQNLERILGNTISMQSALWISLSFC